MPALHYLLTQQRMDFVTWAITCEMLIAVYLMKTIAARISAIWTGEQPVMAKRNMRQRTSIMLSMVTAVMVCAVLGTMTVAPMSSPNDCATSCVNITHAQLAKKPPAVRLRPLQCFSVYGVCES